MIRKAALSFGLLAATGACTTKEVTPINPAPEVVATEIVEQVENNSVDVLIVVDSSGSMAEEQFGLMANIAAFADVIENTGATARFMVVDTDADSAGGQVGDAFRNPQDTVNGAGQLIRNIPNNNGNGDNDTFCLDVANATPDGVLDPQDPALLAVLNNRQIPNFTGRFNNGAEGVFDPVTKIAQDTVFATFADAVGCFISVGIRGSGSEVGLCRAVNSTDPDSLAGSRFLSDPNSLFTLLVVSDEDASEIAAQSAGNSFSCQALALNNQTGSLLGASTEANICGTGQAGRFNDLVPVNVFADQLRAQLAPRDDNKIFVATITGPPAVVFSDCGALLPVPACFDPDSGKASPGNRYFDFANLFPQKIDALDGAEICGDFGAIIAEIGDKLGALLNGSCLSNPINAAEFNENTDIRILFDLTNATNNETCATIGATQFGDDPNVCQLSPDQFDVQPNAACAGGFTVNFSNLGANGATPPTGAIITTEYLASPQ